jgi:hypothetical protein
MNEHDPAPDREPALGDLIEGAVRKLVTGIVIAGGLIGLGLWSSRPSSPGHYQIIAADGRIYRLNMQSGTVIGCEGHRCAIMLEHGQDLEGNLGPPPAPKQVAPPQVAPAPAPAPAPAGAPPAAPPPAPARH